MGGREEWEEWEWGMGKDPEEDEEILRKILKIVLVYELQFSANMRQRT